MFVQVRGVLAVGLFVFCNFGCNESSSAAADAGAERPDPSVTTAPVSEVEVPITLRLSGSLRGNRETDLAANASGRVVATLVERGAQITPGQVLAKLDVRAAALSAAEARAQAQSMASQQDQAQKECARYEQLKAKGAVSDLEYDRAVAQCQTLPLSAEAANARARLAAQNVGDGIIRAPFAGVVTDRPIEVGQYLRQDSRVVTIVSLDPLRLELSVPEADVSKVKVDADVDFTVAAYPGRRYTGKIRFISGALQAATRDLVVEALVQNPDKSLLPGMFADAQLTTGSRKLPSVPRAALLPQGGQPRVFALVANRLEERLLALGPEAGDRVSVTKGVSLGDAVVLPPFDGLSNGQHVR
jgi:membrane fusion protein, multidrug efflux system